MYGTRGRDALPPDHAWNQIHFKHHCARFVDILSSMSQPKLTTEQQAALNEHDGFVRGPAYVLISKSKYREMMGVGDDDEMAASLAGIDAAMRDLKAGQTIPLAEVKQRLDEKYGGHD